MNLLSVLVIALLAYVAWKYIQQNEALIREVRQLRLQCNGPNPSKFNSANSSRNSNTSNTINTSHTSSQMNDSFGDNLASTLIRLLKMLL